MLTLEQTNKAMKYAEVAYTHGAKSFGETAKKVYHDQLKQYDFKRLVRAVKTHVGESTFFPTVAELRTILKDQTDFETTEQKQLKINLDAIKKNRSRKAGGLHAPSVVSGDLIQVMDNADKQAGGAKQGKLSMGLAIREIIRRVEAGEDCKTVSKEVSSRVGI